MDGRMTVSALFKQWPMVPTRSLTAPGLHMSRKPNSRVQAEGRKGKKGEWPPHLVMPYPMCAVLAPLLPL